jgi:transcriptional regulator with XRE-family HTH domain
MSKEILKYTKEIAKLLLKVRQQANLSQKEVAKQIGLSLKSGKGFISHLEKGRIKNPPIGTILLFLRACGASWVEFFKELDRIDFKLRHEKMIAQLPIPPAKRKIEKDAMRYEIGIEFPSKEKEEIDFERLKKIIKNKVILLLNKEEITLTQSLSPQGRGIDSLITAYQKFALEYFNFLAALNKPGMKMVTDKYQRAGLKLHLLYKIKKIINSVLRGEIKRIMAKKPLPTQKQEKMAVGLTKYRIIIERIEAEAHKLLCDLSIPTPWFSLYKDFVRECYKTVKQYYGRNQELLNKALTGIVSKWDKEGLKRDVLLKLQEKVIKVFVDLRRKGIVTTDATRRIRASKKLRAKKPRKHEILKGTKKNDIFLRGEHG